MKNDDFILIPIEPELEKYENIVERVENAITFLKEKKITKIGLSFSIIFPRYKEFVEKVILQLPENINYHWINENEMLFDHRTLYSFLYRKYNNNRVLWSEKRFIQFLISLYFTACQELWIKAFPLRDSIDKIFLSNIMENDTRAETTSATTTRNRGAESSGSDVKQSIDWDDTNETITGKNYGSNASNTNLGRKAKTTITSLTPLSSYRKLMNSEFYTYLDEFCEKFRHLFHNIEGVEKGADIGWQQQDIWHK